MSSSPIPTAIANLKAQLETQLGWGGSEAWSNYDFERLSEQIVQKTGVSLSVSTLKRILGKVDYKSAPSLTTLNTIAQFLNYTDWRDFQLKTAEITAAPVEKTVSVPLVRKLKWTTRLLPFVVSGILFIGFVSFFFRFRKTDYNPKDFRFTSNTMLTQGLPNSVVFNFDATQAHDDSVFICQSWDIRRKVLVHKNDTHHSAIYYYPGFYRAKLMIGQKVMQAHDIQINTQGWLGLVEADWGIEPLYFRPSDIVGANMVSVTEELLSKYNIKLAPSLPKTCLFNQKDMRGIMTNEFTFETEVKSMHGEGANACQRIEVLLQAKNDILIVPLVNYGCVGDTYLAAYGYYAHSGKADLSGFGCHPSEWTKLKVTCKSGLLTFYINQKPVYKAHIANKPTDIIGVQYRFRGPGAVRNTWLKGATSQVVF